MNFPPDLKPEYLPRSKDSKSSILLSLTRTASAIQMISDQLSDIEGGLRAIGSGADKHAVRRIRTASRRVDTWLSRLADDFAEFVGWVSTKDEDSINYEAVRDFRNSILPHLKRRKR